MTGMTKRREFVGLAVCIFVVFAAAAVGSPFTRHATRTWYQEIDRPVWTPPDWVFGPVWSVLYVMMAVAAWLVWRKGGFRAQRLGLGLFAAQLVLNAAWTPIFFGLKAFGLAFAEIVLLWCAILATIIVFWRVKRAAAWLMTPYLAWVTYASTLNFGVWWLNR